jgi:hypothetical protein
MSKLVIKLLLIGALLLNMRPAQAQRLLDFQYSDSLTRALRTQHRWPALDSVGRLMLNLGADYPALRRRLGEAALYRGRPSRALRHYGRAFHENPLDTTARYGLALAYVALNQPAAALCLAPGLPDSSRYLLHLQSPRAITQLEVEGTGQYATSRGRDVGGFLRMGVGSRLSSRLSLGQNFSYFGQRVRLPTLDFQHQNEWFTIRQFQYQALLSFQLSPRWQAKLGGHFLHNDFGRQQSEDQLGYAALAYARPYFTVQTGLYAGTLTDTTRLQADLRLTAYPLGNLKLYGFGRGSLLRSAGRTYPNLLLGVGGQVLRRAWLETYGCVGTVPVLAEADGTYIYNLLDPLCRRAAVSLLILLPQRLSARLTGTVEERRQLAPVQLYTLTSLTTALAWNW